MLYGEGEGRGCHTHLSMGLVGGLVGSGSSHVAYSLIGC
nr:MAG TPA: hypothetical protein [Caudoviricetes sp.]